MKRFNSRLIALEQQLVAAQTEPMVVLLTLVCPGQDGERIATLRLSYIRKDGNCLTLVREDGETEQAFEARAQRIAGA